MEFGVDSHEVFCFACTVVTVDIKISLTDALKDILLYNMQLPQFPPSCTVDVWRKGHVCANGA